MACVAGLSFARERVIWAVLLGMMIKTLLAKISNVEVKENIRAITKTAGKYPQGSDATVVIVIQLEWIFLQHLMKYMGYSFAGVEKLLQ